MPGGKDVSKNIRELYERNKELPAGKKRPRAQIVAIGYSQARAASGKKPSKR